MKKTPENITAYGVFLISRSLDLENRVKDWRSRSMTLKIAKGTHPRRAEKKRRPNRTNGLGCRPSPEKSTIGLFQFNAFSVTALYYRRKGACLIVYLYTWHKVVQSEFRQRSHNCQFTDEAGLRKKIIKASKPLTQCPHVGEQRAINLG
jgi:hypothetical protein